MKDIAFPCTIEFFDLDDNLLDAYLIASRSDLARLLLELTYSEKSDEFEDEQ
jgi:hypothetical protein